MNSLSTEPVRPRAGRIGIWEVLGLTAVVSAAVLGYVFPAAGYRLNEPGKPADQHVLAHRDSAYTAMSWVATPGTNELQLRFFDRVEGGLRLQPTWAELRSWSATVPGLAHLAAPELVPTPGNPGEKTWPSAWSVPDPGSVNASPYISLFPAGVLLNQQIMKDCGGDLSRAAPRILIIGLGSGIGAAHLYHHFPMAKITVVDIDNAVIELVREHYPLIRAMEQRGVLRLVAEDARLFVRSSVIPGQPAPFDLVILDAYTAGSTIPPHLMTREFFAQCAESVGEQGIVMANIIGSYGSPTSESKNHYVLGGALRSMRAAQRPDGTPLLPHAWVIPIFREGASPVYFDSARTDSRNNMTFASRQPMDPVGNAAGWQRLDNFVPLPGLPVGKWVHRSVLMTFPPANPTQRYLDMSAAIPGKYLPVLLDNGPIWTPRPVEGAPMYAIQRETADAQRMEEVRTAVLQAAGSNGLHSKPFAWKRANPASLIVTETDAILLPREVWRVSVRYGRQASNGGDSLVGPRDGDPARQGATWDIQDAPLFTDQKPNADIWNRQ